MLSSTIQINVSDHLQNVLTYDTVLVNEVTHRLGDCGLSLRLGLSINEGEGQLVLVVVLLHVGGGLPGRVGVQACGVFLHHHHEYSFLLGKI